MGMGGEAQIVVGPEHQHRDRISRNAILDQDFAVSRRADDAVIEDPIALGLVLNDLIEGRDPVLEAYAGTSEQLINEVEIVSNSDWLFHEPPP
jgi:hypothetical protein